MQRFDLCVRNPVICISLVYKIFRYIPLKFLFKSLLSCIVLGVFVTLFNRCLSASFLCVTKSYFINICLGARLTLFFLFEWSNLSMKLMDNIEDELILSTKDTMS